MKKENLCYGTSKIIEDVPYKWLNDKRNFLSGKVLNYFQTYEGVRPTGIKRKRMKCPICGRKILSSIKMSMDAELYIHEIPPHKPKKWWKKGKK